MHTIINFDNRGKAEEKLLEKSSISFENKDLIRSFVNFKTAEKVKLPRINMYMSTLRLMAERYLEDRDFRDITKEDMIDIVAKIERGYHSDWTKYSYEVIIKTFYRWLGMTDVIEWIKAKPPGNKKLPEDLITEEEVKAMINVAITLRDKAFIACLYEGGFRIGEIGGLAIKDVTFDNYGAIVMVNGKTGMRRVRLIFAMPYLAQWLELHPTKDDKNAPVWVLQGRGAKRNCMTYQAWRNQLQRIAERAGVRCKVNPHNFRHSRATALASHLTDSQLDEYLGWVPGSKMASVYVHLSGRDLDKELLKMYGIEDIEEKKGELLSVQCPHCRTLNTSGAQICNNCRMPLTVDEVIRKEERIADLSTDLIELVAKNPEIAELLKKYADAKR